MSKIILTERKLKEIISETIKRVITESERLDTVTYGGHQLEILRYDMSNSEDKQYISTNRNAIWDILQSGYEKLGGFKGFASRSDMMKKSPFFTLGYCDGELVTVTVYNDYIGGNKCVGATCVKDERHDAAVKLLELIIQYNIKHWDEWIWIEASGKIEEMCKKLGGFNVPSNYVDVYLGIQQVATIIDEYHYSRRIAGNQEIKTIFGFKNKEIFDILHQTIMDEIDNFTKMIEEGYSIVKESDDERTRIWKEYTKNDTEINYHMNVINVFVNLKDDELINEFPKPALDKLNKSLQFIKNALNTNELGNVTQRMARMRYEEGRRVLKTSTVLEPLKIVAA